MIKGRVDLDTAVRMCSLYFSQYTHTCHADSWIWFSDLTHCSESMATAYV